MHRSEAYLRLWEVTALCTSDKVSRMCNESGKNPTESMHTFIETSHKPKVQGYTTYLAN